MPTDDRRAEVAEVVEVTKALKKRYPRWTIWYGDATEHWWALPPRDQDFGDFVEAATMHKLIASIEVIQHAAVPKDARPVARRTRGTLRPDRVLTPPLRREPAIAWPGSTAR